MDKMLHFCRISPRDDVLCRGFDVLLGAIFDIAVQSLLGVIAEKKMIFREEVQIDCSANVVFDFLSKKHEYEQEKNSPVILLEKTTAGELGIGTKYEERVRMFPGIVGNFYSEIIIYEPGIILEERFQGGGMYGKARYEFSESANGTKLVHIQELSFKGLFSTFNFVLKPTFGVAMKRRIKFIKNYLEEEKTHENG